PLRYSVAYALKRRFPLLHISLNGGIRSLEAVQSALLGQSVPSYEEEAPLCAPIPLDGVMIGRAAYENPWMLAEADPLVFKSPRRAPSEERELLETCIPYLESQLAQGVPLHIMTRHLLSFFSGRPGARRYRQILGEGACRSGAGITVVYEAIRALNTMSPASQKFI
ncbi:MAG TPA: tRNA-dihydrouridine synthase, partial [Fibrobacteraceae bacterium]|nr:tRNA-dihydrouridine synthase [Fibrobacteraceae bacterium]